MWLADSLMVAVSATWTAPSPRSTQNASAPRGPAGSAARQYLLAGLLHCGACGRRLESAWSNGKPAYRCRHGYTSATRPGPRRPKNLYVREDKILPRLAAVAILYAGGGRRPGKERATSEITAPTQAAGLIDELRSRGVSLIYDPATKFLSTDAADAAAISVA